MASSSRISRVTYMLAVVVFYATAGVVQAAEPAYPTRSIRLVVATAPGGGTDATARIISLKLS